MAAGGVRRPRKANHVPRRAIKPGEGQLSFNFETDFKDLGKGAPAIKEAPRAVPQRANSVGRRNLRALSVQQVREELPQMLPFDSSRVAEAGYSPSSGTLYVRFADGTPWNYFGVEPNEWKNFRRSASPGRYINRVLNAKNYSRGNF